MLFMLDCAIHIKWQLLAAAVLPSIALLSNALLSYVFSNLLALT